MQRRIFTIFAVLMLAIGLAACGSDSSSSNSSSSSAADITITEGFTFVVKPVKAGATVTVKNDSSSEHTVTQDSGDGFDVNISGGKTATFTAPAAGTYKFHCKIHSSMHGTLTVE